MTSVLTVDGNSLAHRAYHATPEEERHGAFVAGGMVRMLATAWREGPFDGVLIALDDPDGNRRTRDFPEYKAHREEKDPLLREQLASLADDLARCSFTVAVEDGAEADDLLAAATDACRDRGWECAVLSSDRDLLALVSDTVTMLRPRGSMARLRVYEPDTVRAEFGVRPDQYTELAALRGDPADGLDGVHGVGPKTAARLLRDYGSVTAIYDSLTSLPVRLETALRADRDNVERNLLLMAPLPHLAVDVEDAVTPGLDLDRIEEGLGELDLADAARVFRRAVTRPAPPPPPPPPDEPMAPAEVPAATPPTPVAVARRRADADVPDRGEQEALF